MKIGESIKCPSCGASSAIKHDVKSILECEYCGSMMRFTSELSSTDKTKPVKLTFMLIMLPVIVVILMVVFWMVFQNIRKQVVVPEFKEEVRPLNKEVVVPELKEEIVVDVGIKNKNHSDPIKGVTSISQLKDQLKIDTQINAMTSLGDSYWIFTVTNQGPEKVARPGVMVSMFGEDGRRLVEQGGWAYKTLLESDESTIVFVFVKDTPELIADIQLSTLANKPNSSSENQLMINVVDYSVKKINFGYEFIGDVRNDHDVAVKYTRVVAVAYDAEGAPIGIGNSFSTENQLAPNQKSGFKVQVNVFLAGEPDHWDVWAIARF